MKIEQVVESVRVDLYFPRRNLVVELNGEDHYIKNLTDGMLTSIENTLSKSKYKVLTLAGKKLEILKITNSSNPIRTAHQIVELLPKYPIMDHL